MRYTHVCQVTFVVDSNNPNKPTRAEIINTITDLLYQAPGYIDVEVISTSTTSTTPGS